MVASHIAGLELHPQIGTPDLPSAEKYGINSPEMWCIMMVSHFY